MRNYLGAKSPPIMVFQPNRRLRFESFNLQRILGVENYRSYESESSKASTRLRGETLKNPGVPAWIKATTGFNSSRLNEVV